MWVLPGPLAVELVRGDRDAFLTTTVMLRKMQATIRSAVEALQREAPQFVACAPPPPHPLPTMQLCTGEPVFRRVVGFKPGVIAHVFPPDIMLAA
eukprot:11222872-Alexandrium_andersonii.AAC.1